MAMGAARGMGSWQPSAWPLCPPLFVFSALQLADPNNQPQVQSYMSQKYGCSNFTVGGMRAMLKEDRLNLVAAIMQDEVIQSDAAVYGYLTAKPQKVIGLVQAVCWVPPLCFWMQANV